MSTNKMKSAGIIVWEDRLTRLSFLFLFLAVAYGLAAGSAIPMYYDITPNMGAIQDSLSAIQFLLYLSAVLISLIHLPLVVGDFKNKLKKQAIVRTAAFLGPIIIFLGAEGFLAHFLWWGPISETDRFHMLHHTIVAGAPLTLLFGLGLYRWWRPNAFTPTPATSGRSWLVVGILLLWLLLLLAVPIGIVPPPVAGLLFILSVATLIVLRYRRNK
jgi:hypothetical protein